MTNVLFGCFGFRSKREPGLYVFFWHIIFCSGVIVSAIIVVAVSKPQVCCALFKVTGHIIFSDQKETDRKDTEHTPNPNLSVNSFLKWKQGGQTSGPNLLNLRSQSSETTERKVTGWKIGCGSTCSGAYVHWPYIKCNIIRVNDRLEVSRPLPCESSKRQRCPKARNSRAWKRWLDPGSPEGAEPWSCPHSHCQWSCHSGRQWVDRG